MGGKAVNNRIDFIILSVLKDMGAVSKMKSVTLEEMSLEETGYKVNTLQKKMSDLCRQKSIEKGLKDQRNNTYYITSKGLELLKSELKERQE